MRTEQEMLERILHFAQEREDIKAVYMNGSRANPKAPKDILQDFDIVYVVESTAPYIQDKSWIPFFGEIAVMQEPDDKDFWDNNSSPEKQYAYLLQFKDGNRIDLTFQSLQTARETYGKENLLSYLRADMGVRHAHIRRWYPRLVYLHALRRHFLQRANRQHCPSRHRARHAELDKRPVLCYPDLRLCARRVHFRAHP